MIIASQQHQHSITDICFAALPSTSEMPQKFHHMMGRRFLLGLGVRLEFIAMIEAFALGHCYSRSVIDIMPGEKAYRSA